MKILKIEQCPRCSSSRTGIIEAVNYGGYAGEMKLKKEALRKGYYIKFVSPEDYRTYYRQYDINCFCEDCGYEFSGEIEKVDLKGDKYDEFLKDTKIDKELASTESQHYSLKKTAYKLRNIARGLFS